MLVSSLLTAIPGLRHAFFTREGGVSEGIYDSLNGGLGSRDNAANVAENRRRMAEQLGVEPSHFLNVHQIHSPDVIVATGPGKVPRGRRPTPSSRASKGLRSASPRPIADRSCSSIPRRA